MAVEKHAVVASQEGVFRVAVIGTWMLSSMGEPI